MPENIADLAKLVELKEKGLLTEKEFEVKRRQVLGLRKRGRIGRVLLRLIILLAVFAGGCAAGRSFQRFTMEENFVTAKAEALDADKMVKCDNGQPMVKAALQVKAA